MAYGTPASPADVEAYYTHIRGGRAPAVELVEDLRSRYDAIGGISPLRRITEAQCHRLADALDGGWRVALGQKHAAPFIEDAVAELADAGVARIMGLVLAPHYSRGSVGEYLARLAAAAVQHELAVTALERWHDLEAWRGFQAETVVASLARLPARTKVLFSAHSLPEAVLLDDPYPDELHASATAIAAAAGLAPQSGSGRLGWGLAWQSAGRTGARWRGPDIGAVIDDLAATGQVDGVLVCPQGFTADHLEVLYDLDVVAQARAVGHGLVFARTASLNDDPAVLAALADRLRASAIKAP